MALIYETLEIEKDGVGIGKFRKTVKSDEENLGIRGLCEHEHATKAEAENCPDIQAEMSAAFPQPPPIDTIFKQIREERKRQDEKWGGPKHDDNHSRFEWVSTLKRHINKSHPQGKELYRKQLIRVAALAVAAVEGFDRTGSAI